MPNFKQYRPILKGEHFVVGVDTSQGGLDYSAAQFISKTKLDVPLVYHTKELATQATNDIYPVLNRIFDVTGIKPTIAYERNNGGIFELERLASLNREGKYEIFKMPNYGKGIDNPEATKLGWDTNTATRPAMLRDLKDAIDKRLIQVYHTPTIEEMYSFIIKQTTTAWRAQAEQGAHDDLVMSLAIAYQVHLNVQAPQLSDDLMIFDFPDESDKFGGGFY